MDEILDLIKNRIKQTRIKRKYLIASLIATEILGILVLGWFLRKPINEKYLMSSPKAYSVVVMNNTSRYIVSNNDLLVGNTIPKTKVVSLINPGKIKMTVISDENGNWSYKIPSNLSNGRYQFSVGYFDKTNKLAFFRTYRIRTQSNNRVQQWLNNIGKLIPTSLKKAQAQEPAEVEEVGEAVSPLPESYSIAITSLGSETSSPDQGLTIYPQSLIYDQNGEWVTQNDSLSIDYILESNGQTSSLIPGSDCVSISPCSRQVPEDTEPNDYLLIAILRLSGQEVARSEGATVTIGRPAEAVVAENDSSAKEQECLDGVCTNQSFASVVRLSQLYDFEPKFDDFGQAINISGDCGESCTRPSYTIRSNYLQNDFDLNNLPQISKSQNYEALNTCLTDTRNNPSSILSLIAATASLDGAFQDENPSSEHLNNVFTDFLTYTPITCSLTDYSDESLPELNSSIGMFGGVELKKADFQSLESFYQANRFPVITGTHNLTESHYSLVLAITDNYVWLADPLDPSDSSNVLKIKKDQFVTNFYAGNYWEIIPSTQRTSAIFGSRQKSDLLLKGPLDQSSLPIGQAFLRSGNPVLAFALDDNNAITGKTPINSTNEKFYILGKYNDNDFMYKINFANSEGTFAIPVREAVIEQGNPLSTAPASSNRNNFIGVRINPPFFYDHDSSAHRNELYASEFADLNKLGVGKVRIVIEDLGDQYFESIKPLIDRSFNNGYFVLFQYKPGSRIPAGVEKIRLAAFMQYIQNLGASSDNFAIELYNEPNLRHYWNDCRTQSLENDEDISKENSRAVGWTWDQDQNKMVYVKDCEHEEDYAEALSIAIKQASDIIWALTPNTKLIIGALSLQGATPPDGLTIQDEQQRLLDVYLGELAKYNNLARFDYSIHGYQVWDSGLLMHDDGSNKGADGLYHVYDSYKNNQYIQSAKGSNCNCLWITEFSVDQLNYDAYNLIRILELIKDTRNQEGMINSVFVHEFNGVTEPGNRELWQLWDNGIKLPAYNLLQYYLYQRFIINT